jgi:hypothetical protein
LLLYARVSDPFFSFVPLRWFFAAKRVENVESFSGVVYSPCSPRFFSVYTFIYTQVPQKVAKKTLISQQESP